jgi:N-acetylneuraminic acid mutarotase
MGGTWSSAQSLPAALAWFAAAGYRGSIYVAGGTDDTSVRSDVYRFDPAQGTWEKLNDLPAGRWAMQMAAVGDTLYAAGGFDTFAISSVTSLWAYLPDTDSWVDRASLPTGRAWGGAAAVAGQLVLVGGRTSESRDAVVTEIYDPQANAWREGELIPTPREGLTAQVVDGILYAIGAGNAENVIVESYDVAADAWGTPVFLPFSRWRAHMASAVLGGRIHTLGGELVPAIAALHEALDPTNNEWTAYPDLPTARFGLKAVSLGSSLYAMGGFGGDGLSTDVDIFTP